MTATFTAALGGDVALGCQISDYPRADRCDTTAWECTISAAKQASKATGKPVAIVSTLPETMPEATAKRIVDAGLIPMHGLEDTLTAIEAAAFLGRVPVPREPLLLPATALAPELLDEADAKAALAGFGLQVPRSARAQTVEAIPQSLSGLSLPVALKAEGLTHKTEAGGVVLHLESAEAVMAAAASMPSSSFLIEEMVTGGVAELLIGVVRDPAHGFVLTLAAGGTLTEILQDSVSLLLPVTETDITDALASLRIAPLLNGYRNAPRSDQSAIVRAVLAVQAYVTAHAARLDEVEINPLICTPNGAVAADALIRIGVEE